MARATQRPHGSWKPGVLQSLLSRSQLLTVIHRRVLLPSPSSTAFWAPAGGFPVDSPRRQRSISLCQPHSTTPHLSGLEYPLGSRMHLGVVHPRLEARGRPFPRSPRSRSRVNLRVLRPLTRRPQVQPSPLRTPHGCPGVQGIFPTSRGQAPHGWPMVDHSMATGFPIPRGCCLALSASRPIPCPVPVRHIPSPSLSPRPVPQGNLVEVLGREVRKRSPGELMVESSPSRQRRPPCKTSKEMSDEAADAAALTYLPTYSVGG